MISVATNNINLPNVINITSTIVITIILIPHSTPTTFQPTTII